MRIFVPWMLALAVLPRAEDPWPDTIDFGFPFAVAGGLGMAASVLYAQRSVAERDEAVRSGNVWGFWLGLGLYSIALLNQVAFG